MTTAAVVGSRRRPVARWAAIGAAVVAVALVVVLASRDPARNTSAASPLIGLPAPEVIAPDLDGQTVRLSQYRGRFVLLNFFASWCGPCVAEHDDLVRFSARHASSGDAQVVAVLWDDTPAAARSFFERKGGDWPVLLDDRGKVALDFGVRGPPESFLIDPDGFVVTRLLGEVTSDGLERLIVAARDARSATR